MLIRTSARGAATAADGASPRRQAMLLSLATVVVSAANYGFALLMVRLLPTAEYVGYVAVQSLLLILGAAGMAAVPWAIAAFLARSARAGGGELRLALRFGLLAGAVQAVVFVAITVAVAWAHGPAVTLAAAAAAVTISMVVAPVGTLQGLHRITGIAVLRLIEAVVRVAVSLALVLGVSAGAAGPLWGLAAGSGALFVLGLWQCRRGRTGPGDDPVQLEDGVLRRLLGHSLRLAVVQGAIAALAVVDTVVIGLIGLIEIDPAAGRAYQVAALLGRVPVFLATAVALTYYPRLASRLNTPRFAAEANDAVRTLLRLAVPVTLVTALLPTALLAWIVPDAAAEVRSLLPITAVAGLLAALATLEATIVQAAERFRTTAVVLVAVALLQPATLLLTGRLADGGSATGYAWVNLGVLALALAGTSVLVRSWTHPARWWRSH